MFRSSISPNLKRTLKTLVPGSELSLLWQGKTVINFAGNDYLGLKNHPCLKERAIRYIEQYGVGAGSSRLVSGSHIYHDQLEKRLAAMMGYECALLMNTGYQANISILSALADRDTLIVMDRHCHHSLVQGARLSQGRLLRFAHQDFDQLKKYLKDSPYKKKVIVTESLFSMDGDITPLTDLKSLAAEYGAFLYVDDAHAVGVLGPKGLGLTAGAGIDLVLGTFGKAFGSFGAYILCSRPVCDLLIQKCGGLIYSTALPPPIVGAVDAALDLIPAMDKERSHLEQTASLFRQKLQTLGIDIGCSASHIIPLIVGSEEQALDLESRLFERGCFAPAIRPPTVAKGQSRVRLSLTAEHTEEHLALIG